jgi:hypothetical protein
VIGKLEGFGFEGQQVIVVFGNEVDVLLETGTPVLDVGSVDLVPRTTTGKGAVGR